MAASMPCYMTMVQFTEKQNQFYAKQNQVCASVCEPE